MPWTTCYVETCRIRHGRSAYPRKISETGVSADILSAA